MKNSPDRQALLEEAKLQEALAKRRRFFALDFYKPYPKQAEFHALGATKRERALIAANRVGKALMNGTGVLTPRGWRSIEEMKVGDEVVGGDGWPCYVTGVYPQGLKPLVRMVFDDGAELTCSTDHLWKCRQGRERYKGEQWHVRSTADIIAKGGADGDPQKVAEIPLCVSYMAPRELDIDPYVLGLMVGDGSYTASSTQALFSSGDPELIAAIDEAFGAKRRGHKYDYAVRGGLVTRLKSWGLWGTWSHEKSIPKDFLWNSAPRRLALLQGLMDTDGFAAKSGGAIFYTTSEALVRAVEFLARSLGGKANTHPKQTYFYQRGVRVAGRPSWAVHLKMPVCPFRLKRKAERWKPFAKYGLERRLVSAASVGDGKCTCISVDSADSTFVAQDFIVTHNTYSAGAEVAMHLTGIYPKDWQGKRFTEPTNFAAACKTGILVRDGAQSVLFGEKLIIEARGTGMVPKSLVNWGAITSQHGYSGLYDVVQVKHVSGGISSCQMMTYMQSREAWQAVARHGIWFDEEPPEDIYNEGLVRIGTTDGIVLCTFTPMLGRSNVVLRYISEPSADRAYVSMTLDDAQHFTPEQREKVISGYASYERAARARGEPMLGGGRVFDADEDSIIENAISPLPSYWAKLWGIDFGGSGASGPDSHPFGAVLIAWDKDAKCIHVIATVRMRQSEPFQHARAMLPYGKDIPVAWPFDGNKGVPGYGKPMADLYKAEGLKMLPTHATFKDGGLATEAGIAEMDSLMKTGQFKVASHLDDWREEYRHYHREDGELVKLRDDLMSATRVAIMAKRFARAQNIGQAERSGQSAMCKDVEFDVLDWAA